MKKLQFLYHTEKTGQYALYYVFEIVHKDESGAGLLDSWLGRWCWESQEVSVQSSVLCILRPKRVSSVISINKH